MGILSTSRNTTTLLRTGCDAIRHTSARCFNGLAQFSLAFSSSYLCCAMSWPAKWECENIHDRHDPFQLTYSLLHIPLRGRLILGMFTTFILVSDWESKWWWERGRQPMILGFMTTFQEDM